MAKPKKSPSNARRTSRRVIVKKSVLKRSTITTLPLPKTVQRGELLYSKNQFLAVKNEEGGFYLCRAKQEVHDKLTQFLAQWLEETAPESGHFKLAYCDYLPIESTICQVRLHCSGREYELKDAEKKSIIRKMTSIDDDDDEEEEEDDNDGDSEGESAAKKVRSHSGRSVAKRPCKKPKDQLKRKSLSAKIKRDEAKGAAKVLKRKKRGLNPNPSIKVLSQDPFFHTREKVPPISVLADSRLVMRAVLLGDSKLLQTYINDRDHISVLNIRRSVQDGNHALKYAILSKNFDLIKLINDENKSSKPRASIPPSLLSSVQTGSYNKASLGGLPYVRKLAMSRGSKEGNNAFLENDHRNDATASAEECIKFCLREGIDRPTIDRLSILFFGNSSRCSLQVLAYMAIRAGNMEVAGSIVSDALKSGGNTFNNLHQMVLTYTDEKLPDGIREASVKKKPWDNKKITPLHCAAINPNPYYFSSLFNVLPDVNLIDANAMKPIHYAAACTGTGPLVFLLTRPVELESQADEVDGTGKTPLMIAAQLGRVQNIEVIMKDFKKTNSESCKMGPAGINRPNSKAKGDFSGFTALHYAVFNNQLECVLKLLEHGADIEKTLAAVNNRRSPLMLASQMGFLPIVQALVEKGAKPDKRDKLRKTALMYACINGHTHVCSYLLHIGCDVDSKDSSGNSPLHYAAAYGWYFPVKLLLKAGADASACNDWKLTPLAVSYLKGHVGLANVLLDESKGSIDFRLDGGDTLVMMACSSSFRNQSIVQQVKYLVEEKAADCSLVNDANRNALHILAKNMSVQDESLGEIADSTVIPIARILLEHGCDLNGLDADGNTPFSYAVNAANDKLAIFFLTCGKPLQNLAKADASSGCTLLHTLAQHCLSRNTYPLAALVVDKLEEEGKLEEVLSRYDDQGHTPILKACHAYKNWDENIARYEEEKRCYTALNFGSEDGGDDDDHYERYNHDEGRNSTSSVVKCVHWFNGRKFIRLLLKKMGLSAFEMRVQARKRREGEVDDGKKVYEHPEEAEFSIIDFFLNVSKERSVIAVSRSCDNDPSNGLGVLQMCPGIHMVFKFLFNESCNNNNNNGDENKDNNNNKKSSSRGKTTSSSSSSSREERGKSGSGGAGSSGEDVLLRYVNKYDREGLTPLITALLKRNPALIEMLLKYRADVKQPSRSRHSLNKGSVLMVALRRQYYDDVPRLLEAGGVLNALDERSQCNALHFVCMRPFLPRLLQHMRLCLAHGCDPGHKDVLGQTPLHKLAKQTSTFKKEILEAMTLLLDQEGVSVASRDATGMTALHISVTNNACNVNSSTEYEQVLLERCPEAVDVRDSSGRMALHYAFLRTDLSLKHGVDPIEMTYFLTNQSRDVASMVSQADVNGMTPLHLAASIGAGFCCVHLVEKGSPLGVKTKMGNTALSLAVKNKAESCVMLLMQKGADINCQVYAVVAGRKNEFDDEKKKRDGGGGVDDDDADDDDADDDDGGDEREDGDDDDDDEEDEDDDDQQRRKKKNRESGRGVVVVDPERVIKCDSDIYKNVLDVDEEEEEEKRRKKEEEEERRKKNEEDQDEEEKLRGGKRLPRLVWKPDEAVKALPVKDEHYPVIKGAILNEWQGVMFVMLESIQDSPDISLSSVVKMIFETQKFNLALSLLSKIKTTPTRINHKDAQARTLAHHLALNSRHEHSHFGNVMRLLHQRGLDLHGRDSLQCTPLHYACLHKNALLIEFILEQDASACSLKHKDHLQRTPLAALLWHSVASVDSHVQKLAKLLVERGASMDVVCPFPLHKYTFSRVHRRAECPYLETEVLRDDVCLVRLTPLMYAVANENSELCKVLLRLGADVNAPEDNGVTAIMLAVALNSLPIISILLQAPASQWREEFRYPSFFFMPPLTRQIVEEEKGKEMQNRNVFQLGRKQTSGDGDVEGGEEEDGENEGGGGEGEGGEGEGAGGEGRGGGGEGRKEANGKKETEKTEEEKERLEKEKEIRRKRREAEVVDERTKYMFNGFLMHFNPITKTSKIDLNKADKQGRSLLHYLIPLGAAISSGVTDNNAITTAAAGTTGNHFTAGVPGKDLNSKKGTNKVRKNPADVLTTQRGNYGPDIRMADLKYPAYDNHSLLLFFLSLGATFDRTDKGGTGFRTRARQHGCLRILTALHYHTKQPCDLTFANLYDNTPEAFKTSACIDRSVVAPLTDAKAFLQEYERNHAKGEPKFQAVPDSRLDASMKGEVYTDGDKPCDVLLFKIDVSVGSWGIFNFYKMQLIHQKSKDLLILFTRWGRIGDGGQFQQTPFASVEEALKEFAKLFKAKTGNEWSAYDNFDEKPKKYRLVALENRMSTLDEAKVPIDLTSPVESKLRPSVREMIKEMTNVSAMSNRMSRLGLPLVLSRVTQQQLQQAHAIVDQLKVLVKEMKKLLVPCLQDLVAYEAINEKIAKLSSDYQRILPQKGYEFEKVAIVDSEGRLADIEKMLAILADFELATRFMLAAMNKKHVMNPYDYVYLCLECSIYPLEQQHPETQLLLKYIKSSWSGKVEAIFKVNRQADKGKFKDSRHPRKLLFHGSSPTNLISILSRGLLVQPMEAKFTGNTFGNGVYLADSFEKSRNYCNNYSSNRNNVKYMLVCEADLGDSIYHLHTNYASTYPPVPSSTLLVLGRNVPNPIYDVALPSGAVVPQGETIAIVENWRKDLYRLTYHNEYIVYDPAKVVIRYVVQFISS